jgi:hypothetical protein
VLLPLDVQGAAGETLRFLADKLAQLAT